MLFFLFIWGMYWYGDEYLGITSKKYSSKPYWRLVITEFWDRFRGISREGNKLTLRTPWYLKEFCSTGMRNGQFTTIINKKKLFLFLIRTGITVALVCAGLPVVVGATIQSDGGGGGAYGVGASWNGGVAPGALDDFDVLNGDTIVITGTVGNAGGVTQVGGVLRFDGQLDTVPAIMNMTNGSSLANGGTVDQTGTGSTGYAGINGVSAEPFTGLQPTLGNNSYWKWGELDFQMDITTGGGTCVFEFVDDITMDKITITAGDTWKCVTAGVTITMSDDVQNSGVMDFQGTGGGHITFTINPGHFYVAVNLAIADITLDYVDVTASGHAVAYLVTPAAHDVQNSTFTTSNAARAGLFVQTGADIASTGVIIDCTFVGGNASSSVKTDVSIGLNGTAILDTCTFTTVGLNATGTTWLAHMVSGTMTIWGNLASSETPSAGFRAADITGNLTLSQADQYGTPFNTSYTLGANLPNVDDITIDASTTLAGATFTITASGDIDNQGTYTANTSTFIMNGANKSITGSWTFWHFTKAVAVADILTFEDGETYTFGGNVTINGAVGQLLSLVSANPGTQWFFTMSAGSVKTNLSYLSVTDSDASNSDDTPIDPSNSEDGGNNVDWFPSGETTPFRSSRIKESPIHNGRIGGMG